MEQIYTDLLSVGYDGQAVDREVFNKAFNDGQPSIIFADIVTWLGSQLASLCGLENCVSSVHDENDLGLGFLVEVSSLLKELNCPLKTLTRGPVEDRFVKKEDKMLAIIYMCSELEAEKIVASKKPKKEEPALKIELNESKTAKELREMLVCLSFAKPPENITPQKLFSELEKRIYSLSNGRAPKDVVGNLLFSGTLLEKHWFQLENLYREVYQEYKTRRNLLLTRLDVTVRSFLWADRLKNKAEEVLNIYNKRKTGITDEPTVLISDVLSATEDLALIEKTSSAAVRKNTKSAVNSVRIGSVPDRGGRPSEQQPPPPEVPSWQKNDTSSRGGSRQQNFSGYKNTGDRNAPRNRENDNRSFNDNYQKSGNFNNNNNNRDNYNRGRGDFNNTPVYQPVYHQPAYQPTQFGGQLGNVGFGGYTPAGDNFQQYGMGDGINQYHSRPTSGSGPRPRGGYNDRGSRPFRGQGRGRGGRW